jgi:hypothetical protein
MPVSTRLATASDAGDIAALTVELGPDRGAQVLPAIGLCHHQDAVRIRETASSRGAGRPEEVRATNLIEQHELERRRWHPSTEASGT